MLHDLHHADRSLKSRTKFPWRWFWIILICIAVGLAAILSYPVYLQARATHAVRTAANAFDEQRAFAQVHATRDMYAVHFFDAGGAEMMPHITGDYLAVRSIRIVWSNGSPVDTPVRDIRNLRILLGD